MKAIVTADIHFHNWSDYHTINTDGINSRLEDIIKIFKQIETFNKKNKVDYLFILGDIFHSRSKLDMDVVSLAAETLYEFSRKSNIEIVMLLGNHDIAASNENIHILKIFKPFCRIIDEAHRYEIGNCAVYALPYCISSIEIKKHIRHFSEMIGQESKEWYRLFISHNGLDGASIGPNEYKIESPTSVDDTKNNLFDLCLYGHYHKHQQIAENVYYVGSPLQHSFGERNDEKGFIYLDTESGYHEFVKTIYPKFVQCSPEKAAKEKEKGNYVKIDLQSIEDKNLVMSDQHLAKFPMVDNIQDDTDYEVRLQLDESGSMKSMSNQYVDYMNPEGLDLSLLKKQAIELLGDI